MGLDKQDMQKPYKSIVLFPHFMLQIISALNNQYSLN